MKGQITGKAPKLTKEQAKAFANAVGGFDKKNTSKSTGKSTTKKGK